MGASQSQVLGFSKMDEYGNLLKKMLEEFKKLKDLDSMVFIEIPQQEIKDSNDYKWWLSGLEIKWITVFNDKNGDHWPPNPWNTEGGIHGYFGDEYFSHCKLYKFDGNKPSYGKSDYRAHRGILIRDHYTKLDVVKVHHISNNLEEFLKKEKIYYKRTNFKKRF